MKKIIFPLLLCIIFFELSLHGMELLLKKQKLVKVMYNSRTSAIHPLEALKTRKKELKQTKEEEEEEEEIELNLVREAIAQLEDCQKRNSSTNFSNIEYKTILRVIKINQQIDNDPTTKSEETYKALKNRKIKIENYLSRYTQNKFNKIVYSGVNFGLGLGCIFTGYSMRSLPEKVMFGFGALTFFVQGIHLSYHTLFKNNDTHYSNDDLELVENALKCFEKYEAKQLEENSMQQVEEQEEKEEPKVETKIKTYPCIACAKETHLKCCGQAYYCSTKCQLSDRTNHKNKCLKTTKTK